MPPAVTVLMAVYNGADYLQEAIDSVLSQTFANFELLIVDDGSIDATPEILKNCRDVRLRVIRFAENKGLVAALNAGVDEARAELIARMDGDDVCEPERLQRQVLFMKDQPEVVLLGTSFTYIDSKNTSFRTRVLLTDRNLLFQRLLTVNQFCHPSVVMRTQAVKAVGGYRALIGPAEDYDMWLRLAEMGEIANLSESLLRYRVHGKQVSITKLEGQRQATNLSRALALQRREGKSEDVALARSSALLSKAEILRAVVQDYISWADLYASMGDRRAALRLLLKAVKARPYKLDVWLALVRHLPGGWRVDAMVGRLVGSGHDPSSPNAER